jgi:hypothetical protein
VILSVIYHRQNSFDFTRRNKFVGKFVGKEILARARKYDNIEMVLQQIQTGLTFGLVSRDLIVHILDSFTVIQLINFLSTLSVL